jgi:hypothetical protein
MQRGEFPMSAMCEMTMAMPQKDNPLACEFGFTGMARREVKTLEDFFKNYGVRLQTIARMCDMGFTVNTLIRMTEQELDDVIATMVDNYHVELLFGEKYGIKSAVRAEKKALDDEADRQRLSAMSKSEKKRRLENGALLASSIDGESDGRFPLGQWKDLYNCNCKWLKRVYQLYLRSG